MMSFLFVRSGFRIILSYWSEKPFQYEDDIEDYAIDDYHLKLNDSSSLRPRKCICNITNLANFENKYLCNSHASPTPRKIIRA